MKLIGLLLGALVSCAYAKDNYFGNVTRAELFEQTDFLIPKITINLSDEDYNMFFFTYQCMYETSVRNLIRNEDCYQAPWMNYNSILKKAMKKSLISKEDIKDSDDLDLINNVNITLPEFEYLFQTYTNYTLEEILSSAYDLYTIPTFETDDAILNFDIDGNVSEFTNLKFKVGGKYTKNFEKLGYNIKIKEGQLYERKQIRLRTEAVDPSFLREKLAYDLCSILNLPSLSANYAQLYFNDNYMGLYLLRDAFKSQWIEYTFGEKSTEHLYTCDKSYGNNKFFNCINDDESIEDDKDWDSFIKRLDKTKTRAELEEFFDVTTYIKWQALKYLFGSWDHVTDAHNQVLYMFLILNPIKISGFHYFMILIVNLVPIRISKQIGHLTKNLMKKQILSMIF